MNLKNPLERWNLVLWQPLAGYSVSFLALFALLVFRITNLVPGFSPSEQLSIINSRSLQDIFNNPLFAPHSFLQYLGLKSGHFGFLAMRLPTVLTAIGCAALFFYVCSRWFNFRVGVIATVLFVTNSWFLHVARVATPEVSMLGLLAPLAYSIWLPNHKRPLPALGLGAAVLVLMLYIPGFIWFALLGLIWQRKMLLKVWRESKVPSILALCACLVVLTPLLVRLTTSGSLLKLYFGLPIDIMSALKALPKNLLLIPYRLALVGPLNAESNLGRLPLLDFFAAIIGTIGAYSYATHLKLRRSQLLLAALVLGSLLVAWQGTVSITILLPFIYLLVAGGINFMIEQWFTVFPYNPFARNLAIILITSAIIVVGFFHINRYFIAWPQAPATKATYYFQPQKP